MNYEIRADGTLHIEGYVNAVERDSREVVTPDGVVVEQIAAGTFKAAIDKAANVDVLINHDEGRKIASTAQGNASLYEDNIGLRASVDITDAEVINEARATGVKGWSFGFVPIKRTLEKRAQGVPRRRITELELREVTLVMGNMSPVYSGTSVEIRAEGVPVVEYRCSFDAEEDNACDTVPEVVCAADAGSEEVSEEVRGEFDGSVLREYEMRALSAFETQAEIELRYNPYHDPRNGRFTTAGGGGGGGVLFVGKGQKGKGAYVYERDIDAEFSKWQKAKNAKSKREKALSMQNENAKDIYNTAYDSPEAFKKALADKYHGITSVDKIKTAKDAEDFVNYDAHAQYIVSTNSFGGERFYKSSWNTDIDDVKVTDYGFSNVTVMEIPKSKSGQKMGVYADSIKKLKDIDVEVGDWIDNKYQMTKKPRVRNTTWNKGLPKYQKIGLI